MKKSIFITLLVFAMVFGCSTHKLSRMPTQALEEQVLGKGDSYQKSFIIQVEPDLYGEVLKHRGSEFNFNVKMECSNKLDNGHWSEFRDCEEESSIAYSSLNPKTLQFIFPELRFKFDEKSRYQLTIYFSGEFYELKNKIELHTTYWNFEIRKPEDLSKLNLATNLSKVQLSFHNDVDIDFKLRTQESFSDWFSNMGNNAYNLKYSLVLNKDSIFKVKREDPFAVLNENGKLNFEKRHFFIPSNEKNKYKKGSVELELYLSSTYVPMMIKLKDKFLSPAASFTQTFDASEKSQMTATINNCIANNKLTKCSTNSICENAHINSLIFQGLSKSYPKIREGADYCGEEYATSNIPGPVLNLIGSLKKLNETVAQKLEVKTESLFSIGPNVIIQGSNFGLLTSAFSSNGNLLIGVNPDWKITDSIDSTYLHEIGHYLQYTLTPDNKDFNSNFLALIGNGFFMETFGDSIAIDITGGALGYSSVSNYVPRKIDESLSYNLPRGFFEIGSALRSLNDFCKNNSRDPNMERTCITLKSDQMFVNLIKNMKPLNQEKLTSESFFNFNKYASIDDHQIGLPFNKWLWDVSKHLKKPIIKVLKEVTEFQSQDLMLNSSCSASQGKNLLFTAVQQRPNINAFSKHLWEYLKENLSSSDLAHFKKSWKALKVDLGMQYGEKASKYYAQSNFCDNNRAAIDEKGCFYNLLKMPSCECRLKCE